MRPPREHRDTGGDGRAAAPVRTVGEVVVRPARPGDVEGYLALLEAVAAEGRWISTEPPVNRERAGSGFAEELERDDSLRLIAEADGEVVGSLGADEWRGVVSLGMFVADGWRGRGVGRALLEACLAWAGERGAHKIALQVWPHNTAAVRLYERCGFTVEGRLRRHYRRRNGELWDALVMGLLLE